MPNMVILQAKVLKNHSIYSFILIYCVLFLSDLSSYIIRKRETSTSLDTNHGNASKKMRVIAFVILNIIKAEGTIKLSGSGQYEKGCSDEGNSVCDTLLDYPCTTISKNTFHQNNEDISIESENVHGKIKN